MSERLQQCTTNLTLTYHKHHYIATDVPTIVSATVMQPNLLSTVLTPTRPMRTKPHPTLRAVRCNQVQTSDSFDCYARVHHGSGSRMMQPSTDKHIESKQISDSVVWKSSVHVAFTPTGMRRSTRKFALHIRNLILTLISDSRSDAGSSRFKSFRLHHLSPDV